MDLQNIENEIMEGLKDFQRATVERVDHLYRNGQNRVLIADEVGLGKTLVAKGVVAKAAKLYQETLDQQENEIFKVVYICSNQSIAAQNIQKLKVSSDITVDGVTDTRLSMQHLKIFEQENDSTIKERYIQLIPLTPSTSFNLTGGQGNMEERALMFAVLKRMDLFAPYEKELERLLQHSAKKGWTAWGRESYEDKVKQCDEKNNGEYIKIMDQKLRAMFAKSTIVQDMIDFFVAYRYQLEQPIKPSTLIHRLRLIFARISVEMLKPDLVIMDEFQRFRSLISADEATETGILVDRFLNSREVKVLLLSATPYKLYSTLEEISEYDTDEHYEEFYRVIDFLLKEKQQKEFREVWNNFSVKLKELALENTSILEVKKQAEDALYRGICRTERLMNESSANYIDDQSMDQMLKVTEKDVLSYINGEKLMQETGQRHGIPSEYVKSSPYLFSFMDQYMVKKKVQQYFEKNPDELPKANKKHLWLKRADIKNYRPIEATNARLEKVKERVFDNNAMLLLWVPPSMPYYELQGPFADTKNFSKTLIFSAWEMVPRMVASLLSYESERKTVGRLAKKNKNHKNTNYFSSGNSRFPTPRLRLSLTDGKPNAMNLFALLYPSKYLASLYDPIDCMNQKMSLDEIERQLKMNISKDLNNLKNKEMEDRVDQRWYYLAPIFLDPPEYVKEWLDNKEQLITKEGEDEKDGGQKGFHGHMEQLEKEFTENSERSLGRMPDDLAQVLVNMTIGSPAICAYRANRKNPIYATRVAKVMINRLNIQESTAIIELSYKDSSTEAHWKNVLRYFKDGNFQSVIDEYTHMLTESYGLKSTPNDWKRLNDLMVESMVAHTASYPIDTYNTFKKKILKGSGKKVKVARIRSNFAVGFYKGEGDRKVTNRKDSIRNAFNSPFRPFVLATTSIGQEGLDFHYYCRRIVHWNLPSNPVDLEQREGRINRFKCLAIRQNLAQNYRDLTVKEDLWKEIFDAAREEEVENHDGSSELIPFWSLAGNPEVKIERMVPQYPMSKDVIRYERLIKILSLYRLTLGQARQEELLEHILKNSDNDEQLKDLFVNLCPFDKGANLGENS
ncbi:hypothetical protein ISALK_06310 [Isachenkonia alkalipeptolytica]|uniref:Helicase C-terminal domain-containing protein n=2 Tax=Isachenkonia alkalipeptolytica TaxID=2565777 RepID=A0AA44BEG2_9CLOT|nr:hypothetical protein [Isachenkonia alkalipeptolytica]